MDMVGIFETSRCARVNVPFRKQLLNSWIWKNSVPQYRIFGLNIKCRGDAKERCRRCRCREAITSGGKISAVKQSQKQNILVLGGVGCACKSDFRVSGKVVSGPILKRPIHA
jgi:hypothetical protein